MMVTLLSEAYISAPPVEIKDIASTYPESIANIVVLREVPQEGIFLEAGKIAQICEVPVKGKGVWVFLIKSQDKHAQKITEYGYREVTFKKGNIEVSTRAYVGKDYVSFNGKKFPYEVKGGRIIVLLSD